MIFSFSESWGTDTMVGSCISSLSAVAIVVIGLIMRSREASESGKLCSYISKFFVNEIWTISLFWGVVTGEIASEEILPRPKVDEFRNLRFVNT